MIRLVLFVVVCACVARLLRPHVTALRFQGRWHDVRSGVDMALDEAYRDDFDDVGGV